MGADISNDPGSIRTEFVRAIKDFSDYLSFQKKTGNTFIGISEESQALINSWGSKPAALDFFFEGPKNAQIIIIDSDTGFFKGKSGELLKKILTAMNLSADSIFICNTGDMGSVHEKIKTISPKIIITLGTKAGKSLLNIDRPLKEFRGRFHDFQGIPVMPTFHPSLLLKHPEYKRQVWEDMKLVMEVSGKK